MYTKDACAVPGGAYAQGTVQLLEVSTPQWPELHMDMSTIKRIVLLLQMSTSQGPKLHLEVGQYTTEACATPGGVYTTEV
jgi:hypothetical protein